MRDPPAASGFDADGEAAEACSVEYTLADCPCCLGEGCPRCDFTGVGPGEGGS